MTLECIVSFGWKSETIHVYWTKVRGGLLTQMNAGYPGTEGMTKEDPSLTITFPTFDDTGQYICAAKTLFLHVTGQPINLNVIGGKSVKLICECSKFDIFNYKNTEKIHVKINII